MDLNVRRSSRRTRVVTESGMSLPNDDSSVRTDAEMTPDQQNFLAKTLESPHSVDRVVTPREEDEIHQLEMNFAKMNPKSPANIDIHAGPNSPLLVASRTTISPAIRSRVDPRCDPRAIPLTDTQSRVYQPTDAQPTGRSVDACSSPKQPSGVEVVSQPMTRPRIDPRQIQLLANNHQESWKAELVGKLLRQFNKSRTLTAVSPETDFESHKKEKQFQMRVVPVEPIEEDTSVIIIDSDSDSDTNFCEIRKETKPFKVPVQSELKPLNCQPSDAGKQQPSALALPPTSSLLCKYEFVKGYVSPGTQASLSHLLQVYFSSPEEFQLGAHGIVTTQNNRPTDFGEYDEVVTGPGYQYIRDVGKGSFGCVKMYKDNTTQKEFVIKEILRVDNTFQLETKLHSELHHLNITEVYGFVIRNGKLEILMEYAGVSLIEYTMHPDSEEDLHETKIIEILYQALSGLEYLDSKKIIHYDIKPENICIRKWAGHLSLKICDFGSAKEEKEPPDFRGCTVEYLSPELGINLITTKYQNHGLFGTDISKYIMTTKSDIFSLALTVMFIYRKGHVVISLFNNGKLTYNGLDAAKINQTRQTILVYIAKNPSMVQNLIPDACCSEMKSILMEMVQEFPHKRPSATQLKDNIDYLLKGNTKTPDVPVFLTMNTYTADKRVNLIRQLSSRGASAQNVGYQGAVRNAYLKNRRVSRDHGSLPYGTGVQRMDTSDIDATDELKAIVPKFSSFNN